MNLIIDGIEISDGRIHITKELISLFGKEFVLECTDEQLVGAFHVIQLLIHSDNKLMQLGYALNGGALTGLRSIGMIKQGYHNSDVLTDFGVLVFKELAKQE